MVLAVVAAWGACADEATLPAGYTALDWIASSGTQYIKTGYIHKANTRVECEVLVYRQGGWAAIFGARNDSATYNAYIFFARSIPDITRAGCLCFNRTGEQTYGGTFPFEQRVRLVCEGQQAAWQGLDDPAITGSITTAGKADDGVNGLYIFNLNRYKGNGDSPDTSPCAMKLYAFRISEGEAVIHDYVPCRNAAGEAGLYDLAAGAFLGNAGTGVFAGSDEATRPPLKVTRLVVPTGLYVNTEFNPNQNTHIWLDLDIAATGEYWCGAWNTAYNGGAFAVCNDGGSVYAGYGNNGGGVIKPAFPNGRHVVELDKNLVKLDGVTKYTFSAATFQVAVPFTIFGQNRKNENKVVTSGSKYCHGAKLYDNGTLIRDFVPTLEPWGGVGFADQVHGGTFYGNVGNNSVFGWDGIAYTEEGTTLNAYLGRLAADHLDGRIALVKDGAKETLNAVAVVNYDIPVTVKAGTFSFVNQVPDTYSFWNLTLKGGAALAFDLTPAGCDEISASALDLSDPTAENPVRIVVTPYNTLVVGAEPCTLIRGGLAEGDLAKFRLEPGVPAHLAVQGGALVLVADAAAERTLPAGYTPLASLISTGRQLVKTGISATPDTITEMTFGRIRYSNQTVFFGQGAWAGNNYLFNMQSNKLCMHAGGETVRNDVPENADFRVWVGAGKIVLTEAASGTANAVAINNAVNTADPELAIFAVNDGSRGGAFTFYAMKIADPAGRLLRDFVPCRNPDGEPGLWDYVTQSFFYNTGADHFYTADDSNVRLTRVFVPGGAYVNTGFYPNQNTHVAIDVIPNGYSEGWFGAWKAWNSVSYALSNDTQGNCMFVGFGGGYNSGSSPKAPPSVVDGARHIMELDKGVVKVDGVTKMTAPTVSFSSSFQLFIFGQNRNGTFGVNSMDQRITCYGCKVWDNGTLVRDFVPARKADGTMGLEDLLTGTIYPNAGFGANYAYRMTWDGLAYSVNGTAFRVHEGVFTAADLAGYTDVEKLDWTAVDATAVTNYPGALALLGGTFSVKDNVARRHVVAGTLTLGAGAKLALDVTADGCDTFVAPTLVLSATAEKPVDVKVNAVGVAELGADDKIAIFPGATFAAEDAAKFTVSGMPVQFSVEAGQLYLVRKDVGVAVWTGSAGDGKWSNAGNWRGNTVPEDGVSVKFDLPAGGETTFDIAGGRTFKALVFGETAGAFTIDGQETIGLVEAVTNLSATAQSLAAPFSFGIVGQPFTFACEAGDLAFENTKSLVAGSALVKTGTHALTLADKTLWSAPDMVVKAGFFTTTYTGEVTTQTPQDGAITIEAGGMLDINRDHGNTESIPRVEAYHGKTLRIAGDGDGRGALYNSYPSANWGSTIGKLVLTGDASIGGTLQRVQALSGSRIPGATVEGAYTLTLKTSIHDSTLPWRTFDFTAATFALDRINVTGCFTFEEVQAGTITNGIHFYDGSQMSLWKTTIPTNCADFVVEVGTVTFTCGNASTDNSDVTVRPDAILSLENTANLTFNGKMTVEGVLRKASGGGVAYLGGTLSGKGAIAGNNVRFSGAKSCWELEANDAGFTSKVDVSGVTDTAFLAGLARMNVTYTGTATGVAFAVCPNCPLTGAQVDAIALTVKNGAGDVLENCWLGLAADGGLMLHICDTVLVRTAVWLGNGASVIDEPANWACSNDTGVVEGAIPMSATRVFLPDGCVFNCTNGAAFTCLDLIAPKAIGGDCDWRGVPVLSITNTLNLQGHKLYLSKFAGNGTITDGEYQFIESIRAQKGGFIDTGYIPNSKTRVVMDLQVGSLTENWFGASGDGSSWWKDSAYALANDGNNNHLYIGHGGNSGSTPNSMPLPIGWRGQVELNRNVFTAIERGAAAPCRTDSKTYVDFNCKYTMYLFANHSGSASCRFKSENVTCYGCRVWDENGTLIRDFAPAIRVSDKAVGLYDRVEKKWYANQGSPAFVAGTALTDVGGGEVHIDVAAGKTFTNSSLQLAGTVKLVKEGAGAFTTTLANQSYSGGTVVAEGRAYATLSGSESSTYAANKYYWGLGGSSITVMTNATFDTLGNYDFYLHPFVLAGGTLANTGCDMNKADWGMNGSITLMDDSTLNPAYTTRFSQGGIINLGGKTLTVPIGNGKHLYFQGGSTFTNGTLKITSGGWFHPYFNNMDMRTVDVEMGAALHLEASTNHVHNYTQRYGNTTYRTGTGAIFIYGAYRPEVDYIFNFVMQNGSSFDLSSRTTPLSIKGESLAFADNAVMEVAIGKRPASNAEPVIFWGDQKPANWSTLTFKAPLGARYRVRKDEDGVYVESGLIVILR